MFKYREYKEFLSELKTLGSTSNFRDWDGDNVFLIRHDVDFSVQLAYKLAEIEHDCGVQATFFFLTTCQTYNVMDRRNREYIRKISDMGFEVGLHFDPTLYDTSDVDQLEEFVNHEASIIESVTGTKIRSVSLHNPSVHGKYPMFKNYINTYDNKYFSDDCYISDSRMMFRGKNIYEFIKRIEHSSIQILTHPMHYSEKGSEYPKIICRDLLDQFAIIDEEFMVNSTYKEQIGDGLLNYMSTQLSMDVLGNDRKAMMEDYSQVKAELQRVAQENHKLKTEKDQLTDELAEKQTAVQTS